MGVEAAVFQSGGQVSTHYIPGAYSRIDYVKSAGGEVSINNAVIMGDCRGGKPNELLWFATYSEAKATLRSGDLLNSIKHAFNCSPDYQPQRIAAWRVNPGAQASYNFLETANTVIIAKAWDYGLHGNQVKVKLEAGTTSGKKVTIQFKAETAYIADNVERDSFVIQYTGAETSCTMTITETTLTTVTAGETQQLDIAFASFQTIEDLVDYINDQAGYECTIATLNGSDLTTHLDAVSAQDVKTSAYTATSDLQALIEAIEACAWIDTATYNSSASGRTLPDNIASWAYFTGGTDGAYTSTEWEASLTLLEEEDIQFVGSSSETNTIHALIKTHCEQMNAVEGRNERQFLLGGASGETIAQVVTRAQALNSSAGSLVYPEFEDYNVDNSAVVWWSPAYYAAKLIGLVTCLAVREPMTNKRVSVLSFKKVGRTDLEILIKNGVLAGQKNKSGRLVTIRAVTTDQGSILQKNEFSMQREALYAVRSLRAAVEDSFVGQAMTNSLIASIDTTVALRLDDHVDLGIYNGNPPFWNYKKAVVGDQIRVEYDCNLTPPTNFIFITSHMSVYISTSS